MPIAPNPDFAERPGSNFDKIIAQPKRNALGERAGERWAQDGTSWQPEYLSSFYGSVHDTVTGANHSSYDAKLADQAGGRNALGGGNPAPSWDAVPPEALSGFASGSSGDPGRADPLAYQPRAGFNRATISPLDGLARGSRQNTSYPSKIAPANGGRGRRNPSDITEL